MDYIIEFIDISKIYNKNTILDGVSFKIMPSTITVLVGPNGAGKSTLAKILLDIEKPSSGKIIKKPNLKLAYVPQSFKAIYEIPVCGLDLINSLNLSPESLKDIVFKNDAEWQYVLDSSIHSLSGGQLQSLLLAIAFAQKPDLIILDEPTSYLDIDSQSNFYKILEEQRKKQNIAIFMISHDLHSVIDTADQVLCLNHHLCCSGRPFKEMENLESNIGIYKHIHDHKHIH